MRTSTSIAVDVLASFALMVVEPASAQQREIEHGYRPEGHEPLRLKGERLLLAHRVTSRQRSTSVAFRAKRTFD
jgi:hypothetical protein